MRFHDHLKLPKATNLDMVKCVKITMSDDTFYTVKEDDLVAIQFVKDDKRILVRRGRIKDLVVVNARELSTRTDNVSRIILDCSEQFTVKIIEIKFSDIIKIGGIDDEFDDYNDRITELHHETVVYEQDSNTPIIKNIEDCNCKIVPNNITKNVVSSKGFAITK